MVLVIAILVLCTVLILYNKDTENFDPLFPTIGGKEITNENTNENTKPNTLLPTYANPRMSANSPGGLASAIAAPGPAPEIMVIDNWTVVTR
jgi:hypothetical protein